MAISFDGTDDSYTLGSSAAGNLNTPSAFSICFWLYYGTASINDAFVAKTSATTNGWMVRSIDNADDMALWFGTGTQNRGRVVGGLTTGAWAHWGFRYEGAGAANADRCRIWKNGVEQSLTFNGTIPASATASPAADIIFMVNGLSAQFSEARMANLMAWSVALSPSQLTQQMRSFRPVRTSGLELWFPMVGRLSGGQAVDYGPNRYTTTLGGTPATIAGPHQVIVGAPQVAA